MTEEAHVYVTPNIRDQSIETIKQRAETRRTRRMLAAMEVNQKKQAQLQKAATKDSEKFVKTLEKAQKKLDQTYELLNKLDDDIRELTGLHNRMVLFEKDIGQ